VFSLDFITYNINWYKNKISYFEEVEKDKAAEESIHEAKIMHKLLEDLLDEGYTLTYEYFQNELQATERLSAFLNINNSSPFSDIKRNAADKSISFSSKEILIDDFIKQNMLITENKKFSRNSISYNQDINDTLKIIFDFSRWIFKSVNKDTAVIFLLRDTLLPYLAFLYWNKDTAIKAYPFIIGRSTLSQFGDADELYNKILDAVYSALQNYNDFSQPFQETAADIIRESLINNIPLYNKLAALLSGISQTNICVVESGMHGTMPLLLKSVDDRINNIKLFTTIPCFYNAWDNCYFTKKYEYLRLFETLFCQDSWFRFSSIKETGFYISENNNMNIKEFALYEIEKWNNMLLKS
jgi:hypothetical protein